MPAKQHNRKPPSYIHGGTTRSQGIAVSMGKWSQCFCSDFLDEGQKMQFQVYRPLCNSCVPGNLCTNLMFYINTLPGPCHSKESEIKQFESDILKKSDISFSFESEKWHFLIGKSPGSYWLIVLSVEHRRSRDRKCIYSAEASS